MKVLLGVDGTESSGRALHSAAERAAEAGDDLTVAIAAKDDDEARELERRVRETLDGSDVDAEIRHIGADPSSRLVELADSEHFDRLVIGCGERSPMGKIEVKRDAQFVILNARTSVTLVR